MSDQESMKRLKKLMTIMDSMNDKVNARSCLSLLIATNFKFPFCRVQAL